MSCLAEISGAVEELHSTPIKEVVDMIQYVNDEYSKTRKSDLQHEQRAAMYTLLENRAKRLQSEIDRRFRLVDTVDRFCRENELRSI